MVNLLAVTIKSRRERLGLTQEELSKKIGVDATTVSLYESGTRKPKLSVLNKISKVLSISVAALLGIEVPKADLDIALRAHGLRPEDIEEVRRYIQLIRNAGIHSKSK